MLYRYPGASLVVNGQSTGEGGDPIEIELVGTDMETLRRISGEVQLALRQIPGAIDVRDDLGGVAPRSQTPSPSRSDEFLRFVL